MTRIASIRYLILVVIVASAYGASALAEGAKEGEPSFSLALIAFMTIVLVSSVVYLCISLIHKVRYRTPTP